MVKCNSYEVWEKYTPYGIKKTGICNGTKEREECSCEGDKTKCDFYPDVKEQTEDFEFWKSTLLREIFSYSAREHVEVPLWVVRTIMDFKE